MLKSIVIVALLFSVGTPHAQENAPEVITQSITRLFPRPDSEQLGKGDVVVLDMDNTIGREPQLLGTDDWYAFAHARLTEAGYSAEEAHWKMVPLNQRIKETSPIRLMEPEMAAWIESLQAKGVLVVIITARNRSLAASTLKHLGEHGIKIYNTFDEEKLRDLVVPGFEDQDVLFSGGVFFVKNTHKGRAFEAILKRVGFHPRRVLAVDDRIHHVHSLVEVLLENKIPGRVIHYLKALEEPAFDPRIADFQTRYFEATGYLMSDEVARRQCELILSPGQVADFDFSQ